MSTNLKFLKLGWPLPCFGNFLTLYSVIWSNFYDVDKYQDLIILQLLLSGSIIFLVGFCIQFICSHIEINKIKQDLLLPEEKEDLASWCTIRRRSLFYTLGAFAFVIARSLILANPNSDELPFYILMTYKTLLLFGYCLYCVAGLLPKKASMNDGLYGLLYYCDMMFIFSSFGLAILCLIFMILATETIFIFWVVLEMLRTICLGIVGVILIINY
jgi:hypothetical protein